MRVTVLLGLLVLLLAPGCGGGGDSAEPSADVVLEAANGSGVTGTATVTRVGPEQTRIEVHVDDLAGRAASRLVAGECGGFDEPVVRRKLEDVVDGDATTEVPLSFDDVTGTGLTIAVARGGAYVACGSVVP
jgi:hypothetical protein